MGSMKVHQLSRGLSSWDHHHDSQPPSLTLSCKRLRPLAPKLASSSSSSAAASPSSSSATSSIAFDLKSFIKPESRPRKPEPSIDHKRDPPTQVETHPGGTRWNPTQEQIGILEMLYRGGMRTPNAHEIEQITAQLGKYGKIEGKNVFYWFQNHKARERQKQKRNNLGLGCQSPKTASAVITTATTTLSLDNRREMAEKEFEGSRCKRTCRSWEFESLEVESNRTATCKLIDDVTLELFPLHPEGR